MGNWVLYPVGLGSYGFTLYYTDMFWMSRRPFSDVAHYWVYNEPKDDCITFKIRDIAPAQGAPSQKGEPPGEGAGVSARGGRPGGALKAPPGLFPGRGSGMFLNIGPTQLESVRPRFPPKGGAELVILLTTRGT